MRWHLTDTAYPVPAHGAKFDVTTGAVAKPPAVRPVEKYAVRVKGDAIEVEVETDGANHTPPEPKNLLETTWHFYVFASIWCYTILFQYFSFSKMICRIHLSVAVRSLAPHLLVSRFFPALFSNGSQNC